MSKKFVAYVGTYTHGDSEGIYIYDLDLDTGSMDFKKSVTLDNVSHMVASNSKKYLYSLCDIGVQAFEILKDGDLKALNLVSINGMRGHNISIDAADEFLFVAGYHDGKITVLRLNEDGSIKEITDGIFHKGLGSIAERDTRPHISCASMTPNQNFVCVVDMGMSHIHLYSLNKETGKLKLADVLRCEIGSGPRNILFHPNRKFAYVNLETKSAIQVYSYNEEGKVPEFELIQTINTLPDSAGNSSISVSMKMSKDGKYLYSSNAGNNSVAIFEISKEEGTLTLNCSLPISGDYPKDIQVFPDNSTLVSVNHESNQVMRFRIVYDKKYFYWIGKPIALDTPNCITIVEIDE